MGKFNASYCFNSNRYDAATKIAKAAHLNGTTLEEEAIKSGLIDKETFTEIVRPEKMINPTN